MPSSLPVRKAHAPPSRRREWSLPTPLSPQAPLLLQEEVLGSASPPGSEPVARLALPGRTHLPRSRLWPPPFFPDPTPSSLKFVTHSASDPSLPKHRQVCSSKARNWVPSARISDQPHYPASRVNSNNSPLISAPTACQALHFQALNCPRPQPLRTDPGNYCPQYIDERTAAAPESWMTRLGSHRANNNAG